MIKEPTINTITNMQYIDYSIIVEMNIEWVRTVFKIYLDDLRSIYKTFCWQKKFLYGFEKSIT